MITCSFSKWVFLVLALVSIGWALENEVPLCAISCLRDNLKETSCAADDTQCLCNDRTYNELSTACVSVNCTVQEALTTKNITSIACGDPVRNKDSVINVSRPILLVFKTIFIFARVWVKAMGHGGGWGWDDYTILLVFGSSIGMTALTFLSQQNGIGRDIWTLMLTQVSHFLKFFFVFELLFIICLGLTKSSLMCFYARHFPSPNVRLTLRLTQMLNLFLIIAFSAATMLQCQPLSYFWTGWDDTTIEDLKHGQCFNINAFGYAHAGLNIGLNVWLLVLPLIQLVWAKKLGGKQKIGVGLMFAMGIGLTAIAVVRLRYLWYVKNTANPTHDYFGVSFLSGIEVDMGIVLVCMPAMRLFFTKVLAKFFATTRPCSTYPPSLFPRPVPEDSKKLISNPINKQPLPENHNWGFAKKHGYYDEGYDDWDCRIDWNGGPRDNPPPSQKQQQPQQPQTPRAQMQMRENGTRVVTLDLQPPTPFYNTYDGPGGRPSIGSDGGRPSMEHHHRSLLTPTGWRETLSNWRERRNTRGSARSFTPTRNSRRDTGNTMATTMAPAAGGGTSRIGEIRIMIDRGLLRGEASPIDGGSYPTTGPKLGSEGGVACTVRTGTRTTNQHQSSPPPGMDGGNHGGWI